MDKLEEVLVDDWWDKPPRRFRSCQCGHVEEDHDWVQDFDGDSRPINAPYQVCFQCTHADVPSSAHEFSVAIS